MKLIILSAWCRHSEHGQRSASFEACWLAGRAEHRRGAWRQLRPFGGNCLNVSFARRANVQLKTTCVLCSSPSVDNIAARQLDIDDYVVYVIMATAADRCRCRR